MEKKELAKIRNYLGKTQKQMAQLLGTSLKAIKSYEQGWRNIPGYIERQVFFLLAAKEAWGIRKKPCWEIIKCSMETRQNCPAWEFNAGYLCWFINGTVCEGKVQKDWSTKIKICRQCKVLKSMLSDIHEQ